MPATRPGREPAPTISRRGKTPPKSPPPGPVDVGLALLVARTAGPLAADAKAALTDYLTTVEPRAVRSAAVTSNLTEAEVRTWVGQATRLAAQTGTPASLSDSVSLLRAEPRTAGHATTALADTGLTQDPLHPAAVLRLAALYRLPNLPVLRWIGGQQWVIPADTAAQLRNWQRHATTRLTIIGLAPLTALPPPPHGIPLELVHNSLASTDQIRYGGGWVWRINSRGRIPRLAQTLLLAGPQTPDTIAAGLHDQRMTVPPTPVLASWLDTVDWARPTTAGRYTARHRDTTVVGKWDQEILQHSRAGKPLTTAALAATLHLDRNHLGATLRRSVLLEHVSYGQWRIRRASRP